MTPAEHRQEAERLLALNLAYLGHQGAMQALAKAQVHALLALGGQQT